MKLSERERRILACLEHRANQPVSKLCTLIGCRDHILRRTLKTLGERGVVLGIVPFINMYRLGLTDYTLYFSLASERQKDTARILKELQQRNGISWLAALGGNYQYGMSLCAASAEEALLQIKDLAHDLGAEFFEKSVALRISFAAFGRSYLAGTCRHSLPLTYGGSRGVVSLDQNDRRILAGMANTPYSSLRSLSRALQIPIGTLERRVHKLENEGVITGYIYRYRAARLGASVYKLLVFTRAINPDLAKGLYTFSQQHLNVTNFSECLGAWDYELTVEVEQPEDVLGVTHMLFTQFGRQISGIQQLQVFRHLRFSGYPFS